MRLLFWLGLVGMIMILLAVPSYGVYETPTSRGGCQIEPYAKAFGGRMLDALHSKCEDQWYDVVQSVERVGGLNPEITLAVFVSRLENAHGVIGIATEGGPPGLAVEVYEYTPAGAAACSTSYLRYLANGYSTGEISWYSKSGCGYHIVAKPALISGRFQSAKSTVYVGACNGMSYASSWLGAREVLGYTGTVSTSLVQSEANTFWSRMNGEQGKASRYVGGAKAGLTLERSGPGGGSTVLSPTVESYYPPENTAIGEDSVAGWVVFDARMDLSIDPSTVIIGNQYLRVKHRWWSRGAKDSLKYILKSVCAGGGSITLSGQSEGGMMLDGNQDPYGTDGVGPNGDAYVVSYNCVYTDPNYAARFGSQWAYREDGEVIVGWHAEAERGTREYIVEATNGQDWACGWEVVGRVVRGDVGAPGIYSVCVVDGYAYYRVVEIDEESRRGESRPMRVGNERPEMASRLVREGRLLACGLGSESPSEGICAEVRREVVGVGGSTRGAVPDWVFYGPDSLLVECGPAVSWFQSKGLIVDLESAPSPDY